MSSRSESEDIASTQALLDEIRNRVLRLADRNTADGDSMMAIFRDLKTSRFGAKKSDAELLDLLRAFRRGATARVSEVDLMSLDEAMERLQRIASEAQTHDESRLEPMSKEGVVRPESDPERWSTENTRLSAWFERDRAIVTLYDEEDQEIASWVDEDFWAALEAGYFPSNAFVLGRLMDEGLLHKAAVEYANELGLIPMESPEHAPRRARSR